MDHTYKHAPVYRISADVIETLATKFSRVLLDKSYGFLSVRIDMDKIVHHYCKGSIELDVYFDMCRYILYCQRKDPSLPGLIPWKLNHRNSSLLDCSVTDKEDLLAAADLWVALLEIEL